MPAHERLTAAIVAANENNRPALVPFITAGYPEPGEFINTLKSIAEVGDVVEGFTLPALDGAQTNLDYTDRETLLLFFSPDCPACKTNFANWQAIEDSDLGDNRRVVFISTVDEERTRQYVADKNLRSEVLVGSPSVLDRYKVARIPTTVQVGPGGVVNGVWIGVLSEAVVAEL